MKKAYVKPVFFAEEFVAEANYAAQGCGTYGWNPVKIFPNLQLCAKFNKKDGYSYDGHVVNGNGSTISSTTEKHSSGLTYWEYAGMTTTESGNNYDDCFLFNETKAACDFVWNNTADDVYVWDSVAVSGRDEEKFSGYSVGSVANFFYGNSANINQHQPMYEHVLIPS